MPNNFKNLPYIDYLKRAKKIEDMDSMKDIFEALGPKESIKTMNNSGEIDIEIPTVPLSVLMGKSKKRKNVWVSKKDIKKTSEMDDATFDKYWNKAKQHNSRHRHYEFGRNINGDEIVTMGKRKTSVKEMLDNKLLDEPIDMVQVGVYERLGTSNVDLVSGLGKNNRGYLFEDETDTSSMLNGVVVDAKWVDGSLNININVNGETMFFSLTKDQSSMLVLSVDDLENNANMLVQKTLYFMPDYSDGVNNIGMKQVVVK